MLRANFLFQKARLALGCVPCLGQPCQKQPSTKTASRSLEKTKSGLTLNFRFLLSDFPISLCRRQPVMRCRRNNFASASSVSLFPRPRIRDITSERLALVKTSGIERFAVISGQCQPPFYFIRLMLVHPVVKTAPLRVATIQFLVGEFACVRAPPVNPRVPKSSSTR